MSPRTELHQFLTNHGQDHRTDEILKAYRDGTLKDWLDDHGLTHLGHTGLPALLMAADADEQYDQCRQWRDLFRGAGYTVVFGYTDREVPFNREWTVYELDAEGIERQVATFDIDGCGASWHGPDALWLTVVGPSEGVTD